MKTAKCYRKHKKCIGPICERSILLYDNGGKTFDRYTAVYKDMPIHQRGMYNARGMSENPFHPQGFGQMTSAMIGRHLGRRITFKELPEDCQKLVLEDSKTAVEIVESKGAV